MLYYGAASLPFGLHQFACVGVDHYLFINFVGLWQFGILYILNRRYGECSRYHIKSWQISEVNFSPAFGASCVWASWVCRLPSSVYHRKQYSVQLYPLIPAIMNGDIAQLMDMGASRAQATAALTKYKDMMQAAERFFDGEFENVKDEDAGPPVASGSNNKAARRAPVSDKHSLL